MIQPNKHRTTFRKLKPGMCVYHNDEMVKITQLRERKITEKGLIYHFDIDGGNGSLIGESGKRIFISP